MPRRVLLFPALLDWFVPETARREPDRHQRARVFVVAHLFGPPLGLLIILGLYAVDPAPSPHLWILASSIGAFFACPFILKAGVPLEPLSFATVQNLSFVVLFGSYEYGGASSPFLCWLLTVPLLSSFYLGSHRRWRLAVLAFLMVYLAAFYAVAFSGHGFPEHVALPRLAGVGALSLSCAVIFVSIMALRYANIAAWQQRELELDVEKQRVTERLLLHAKEEAERASHTKSAFLATMSHELRTPLNAIIGFSEAMSQEIWGPLGDKRYQGYARDVLESGQHLLGIINDILDLSKIEAGHADLDGEEDVDLGALVRSVARLMAQRAEQGSVTLAIDAGEPSPWLLGSTRMLRQILLNLLSNGIKFTPAGGTVTVRLARLPDGSVSLSVTDTGIGMSDEDMTIALTPFGQVDSALNRRYEGAGLGLPLAKTMVELHQGVLRLRSKRGGGTTVEAVFPPTRVLAHRATRAAPDRPSGASE